jgi:ADP-ribose pyrophosphatase YjhB (NUDIX family)
MTASLGASVAIIRNGQVLLTKRADVEVWTLPGGGVETGESVAEAAIREAREETGLEVRLLRLVGIYFIPRWTTGDSHGVLFSAIPVGGALEPQQGEVIEVGYFDPQSLPEPLVWWQRQRIYDALDGVGGGAVWTQKPKWPFEEAKTRQEFYELIRQSGLSRQEFFLQHFSKPEPEPDDLQVLHVGGRVNSE